MNKPEANEQPTLNLELLEQIAEFNLSPVHYIHTSWLKEVEHAQLIALLREQEESRVWLSKHLLNCFALNTHFDYEFSSPEKRIALATSDELVKLVLYVGIVLNERLIRSVIMRSQRIKLKDCLGEDAYYFAVKKAQFLSTHNYSSTPSLSIDWEHIDRFKSTLMTSGLQVLSSVYGDMSGAFKKRLSFKFPKSWSSHLEQPASSFTTKEQGRNLLIKSYKEVSRQWRHLLY